MTFDRGDLVQYVGPREKYAGIGRVENIQRGRGHFAPGASLKDWPNGEFPSWGPHYFVRFRDCENGWFRADSLEPAPAIDRLADVVET